MIRGTTSSGFSYEIDEDTLDNMELIDAMARADSGNPLAISDVCHFMLGDETRKALYDHVRTAKGNVPLSRVKDEVIEIFTHDTVKKSSPSQA